MSPYFLFGFVLVYFLLLLGVAWRTSRNADNNSFFIGNRNSNWMLVAFGMIGTSLSGVTFVSVPGTVGSNNFGYFQVVTGNFIGYCLIAFILLPLYYKMQVTSIYNYLLNRFGKVSYKTGALFFIISRILGATARLYLVINVLQIFILDNMHVPFWLTTFVILLMILLYTFEGGVKTIVFTDMLQTTCMLLGLVICIYFIMDMMHFSFSDALQLLHAKNYTKVFNTDMKSGSFFIKQIIGGAFLTVGMTGLDQEMMQKNISVRTLKGSQTNMMTFSLISVGVNFLFLFLGGLLYLFAASRHIDIQGDDLFPTVALNYLPPFVAIIFIIGLISALFPSADGALTALTSSFCIDILGLRRNISLTEKQTKKTRIAVHITFALIFFLCIMIFKWINDKSIINVILIVAGYTYGPLLGLFAFGIFTKRALPQNARMVIVCIAAPVITYMLSANAIKWFNGYAIGLELLLINGLLTFAGLLSVSKPAAPTNAVD
ncbi:sodium:solute symporter [Parafilimonas sp.]|uniref:sodium:solute symporter n=1 Tax=Parafilimonas sp. TaxID=1969739 RepID=UPI0039E3E307